MNELSNTVSSVGNYDNIPTSLTSNTTVVNIIDNLSLLLEADKQNWTDGNLTYKITINNETDKSYDNPVITDVLDINYIDFVEESVMIDNVKAETSKYTYNESNHTLTINLDSVAPSSKVVVTFSVKKKIQ